MPEEDRDEVTAVVVQDRTGVQWASAEVALPSLES